jgi:DNA mismatch repair ATPase MutL
MGQCELKVLLFSYQNSEFLYVINQRAIHNKRSYERLHKDVLNHLKHKVVTGKREPVKLSTQPQALVHCLETECRHGAPPPLQKGH